MATLDPGAATRRILRGLQVAEGCLDRKADYTEGYTQLLHFLLTPSLPLRTREILRSLWVGEAMLLDRGHQPDQMPGLFRRSVIALRQIRTLLLISWRAARALASG